MNFTGLSGTRTGRFSVSEPNLSRPVSNKETTESTDGWVGPDQGAAAQAFGMSKRALRRRVEDGRAESRRIKGAGTNREYRLVNKHTVPTETIQPKLTGDSVKITVIETTTDNLLEVLKTIAS